MSRPKWLNPLNSPYGDELVLQNKLSTNTLEPSGRDAADDGIEVFIIRETKRRSQRYYNLVCTQAKIFRDIEEEHILEVERKFIQEVEALEHIRRSDIQTF